MVIPRALIGVWRGGWQHRRDVLFSLGDFDRAVKGGKLDFRAPVVHRAKKALRQTAAAGCRHAMTVWHHRRLIDDIAIKGSGSDVKRIGAGKAHFDRAAVVLQYVDSAIHETAVEEDVPGR